MLSPIDWLQKDLLFTIKKKSLVVKSVVFYVVAYRVVVKSVGFYDKR